MTTVEFKNLKTQLLPIHSYTKLAFCGLQRSGKDTAADFCINNISRFNQAKILKFADPLYEISEFIQKTCGFPVCKERKLLQYIGTDYAREKDPEVWLNVFRKRISEISSDTPIIVTDGRFLNELNLLKELGFYLIKIERDEKFRISAGATHTNHASELDLDKFKDWNLVITNDSSVSEFYKTLKIIFDER